MNLFYISQALFVDTCQCDSSSMLKPILPCEINHAIVCCLLKKINAK